MFENKKDCGCGCDETLSEKAQKTYDAAKEKATEAADAVKEGAEKAYDKAKEAASRVKHNLSNE